MNFDKIKNNWRTIIVAILLLINTLMQLNPIKSFLEKYIFINWVNIFLTLIYIILETIEKIKSHASSREIEIDIEEIQKNTKVIPEIRKTVEEIDKKVDKNSEIRKKKYDETKPIAELINENLISIKTIEKNLGDKRFITVLCYQKGLTKPKNLDMKRDYPIIFEKLGFVRLAGRWGYFIIAEDNIYPKNLRSVDKLSRYLLNKAKISLEKEWNEILAYSKKSSKVFYNNRKNKENPLNFNMLVSKINRRDMRHEFLKKNEFNREFNSELASLTQANKVKLEEEEKIKIKEFVVESSLNILVLSVTQKDKEKILALEHIFKKPESEGGLGIKKFYDYHKKERKEILKILKTKFSEDLSNKYSNLIIKNSKKYEDVLRRIGINI